MRKSTRSELEQLITDIHSHCINIRDREIYLHGVCGIEIEDDPGIEYQMANAFIKNLHILNSQGTGTIIIHMHSPGGNWIDGMAMFNAIRFSNSPVVILAYGQAASMSGVLLQAADKRVLMPDCSFMIHHGSLGMEKTNSIAAKSIVDMNEIECRRMLDIFANRAKKGKYFKQKKYTVAGIAGFIDRKVRNKSDWYLSPHDAFDMGFTDGILGYKGFENIGVLKNTDKFTGAI